MPHALDRRRFLESAAAALVAAGLGSKSRPAWAAENEWVNWSGSVRSTPAVMSRPKVPADVSTAIEEAVRAGSTLRPLGSGHSFVPLCETDGTAMVTSRLRGVEEIDAEHRQATVLAGSKLYQIGRPLREAGLAMECLPDVDRFAIAGATATSTHGTGRRIGSLSTQVVAVRLVNGHGEVVDASLDERPDVLRAAQVHLGALGVLTHVRLQLVPAFRLHERTWIAPYGEMRERLDEQIADHRHFEFFWVSQRDACLMKTLDPTEEPEDSERYEDEEKLVGEKVGWSDEIFPSVRSTPFNEIEYALPEENGPACLEELRQLMLQKHPDVTWPLEYRTVAADDIPLSQFQGRASVTISAHQAAELPHQAFFDDVEAVFRNHRGRPHWGKMHRLTAKELAPLYPRWEAFQKVREELDPQGRFLNPYLRRLLIGA